MFVSASLGGILVPYGCAFPVVVCTFGLGLRDQRLLGPSGCCAVMVYAVFACFGRYSIFPVVDCTFGLELRDQRLLGSSGCCAVIVHLQCLRVFDFLQAGYPQVLCVDFAEVVINGNAHDLGWVHVMCAFCCRLFRVLRRVGCAWFQCFPNSIPQLEKRKTPCSLAWLW